MFNSFPYTFLFHFFSVPGSAKKLNWEKKRISRSKERFPPTRVLPFYVCVLSFSLNYSILHITPSLLPLMSCSLLLFFFSTFHFLSAISPCIVVSDQHHPRTNITNIQRKQFWEVRLFFFFRVQFSPWYCPFRTDFLFVCRSSLCPLISCFAGSVWDGRKERGRCF